MNPFYTAHPTSLSGKSEHDWNVMRSHWSMYSGSSFVRKLGRRWTVEGFGLTYPGLFETKTKAIEYVDNLLLAEGRWRAHERWEADNKEDA